jgi:uncharacterized repeat protein (TIGR01451 family)
MYGQLHDQIAKNYLSENASKLGLSKSDIQDLILSSSATSSSGITYIYLNQAVDDIPIKNAIMTMIIDPQGKVVSDKHRFVTDAKNKINCSKPKINPDQAIINAASHLGVKINSKPIMVLARNMDNTIKYTLPELAKSPISAKQVYVLRGQKLILAWNLKIDVSNSSDYWNLSIDASNGDFLDKTNYTIYCQHHKDQFRNHDDCTFQEIERTDASPSLPIQNLESQGSVATYNVFKLPIESPNHGNRSLVRDDAFPQSSPFGWHDINGVMGPEFTNTRGNNVHAYQDKNDDDDPDGIETDGGSGLSFNFALDLNKDPRESANASVTNLFYMVNMIHDITALCGFTEEFGNFQAKNYSGKSLDGESDYVLAQAFDGIELFEAGTAMDKINNANFFTPEDGNNGRMQMYFWANSGGSVSIEDPMILEGFIETFGTANFGSPIPKANQPAIESNVVLGIDNTNNPSNGCSEFANPNEVAGKIAMVDRGLCEFGLKVLNAENAGAAACIICNVAGINGGNGEEILTMGPGAVGAQVTIPSIFMRKSDCDKIKNSLSNDVPVRMKWQVRDRVGSAYFDGSFDNGVIAHEFGHGISNRLTGGRLNAVCLSNEEQMGEGWSDFFSLVMTHEPGDKGTDARGIGTFARGQTTSGGGIRRYPYSTDMNVNPQTFDDIKGTTAPHPLGEVWADMLWDLYWKMIEKHGYNPDWSDTNSGNYKAVFLVLEGMKIQPCDPGFIDGRDAIFSADKIHFNGEHECLLWEVFARRGLGYFASGGDSYDRNDGIENFDALPTCIEKLKITKSVDSQVDPGDNINVKLNIINHVKTSISGIEVTDEIPSGTTYVDGSASITPSINGNKLIFPINNLEYDKPLNITYKLRSSPNNKSITLHYDGFDGDILWDIQSTVGTENWLPVSNIYRSEYFSFRIPNVAADVDATLISPEYLISGVNPVLRFYHQFDTEITADGGFMELSVDGGPFRLVPKDKFIRNSYNTAISYNTVAIPSLEGFSGSTQGKWIDSYLDLSEYMGKKVKIRYRFVNDEKNISNSDFNGWIIDDISLIDVYTYVSKACISSNNGTANQTCTEEVKTFVNPTQGSFTDDQSYFIADITPNPASNNLQLIISGPSSTLANLSIVSADGRVINQLPIPVHNEIQRINIDIQDLNQGVYVVKIESGNKVFNTKFLKI